MACVDRHGAPGDVKRGHHEAVPITAHLALAGEVRLTAGLDYDEQVPDRAVEGPVVEPVAQPVAPEELFDLGNVRGHVLEVAGAEMWREPQQAEHRRIGPVQVRQRHLRGQTDEPCLRQTAVEGGRRCPDCLG